MNLPDTAKIEQIGISSLSEIENHRIAGSIFVQYRTPILDNKGKQIDVIVSRFSLPVEIFNTEENPDLRELSLSAIEALFLKEVDRVFSSLPKPMRRIENK